MLQTLTLSLASLLLATSCYADNSDLVGTWSSKSNSVFTGSGFYDPIDELLIEPALPGISYSFTSDGFFEEALYQVTSNSKNHTCPTGAIIFQHGTYAVNSSGYITLTPFKVDGRQLLSEPCEDGGSSVYSRYNQTEVFKTYAVYVDPYHGRYRLDLVKSTGAYLQPLYLAYKPPQMLPTITLNPTEAGDASMYVGYGSSSGSLMANTATAEASTTSTSAAAKVKRDETMPTPGLSQRVKRALGNRYKTNAVKRSAVDYDFWFWCSAGLSMIGATMFLTAKLY